MTQPPLFNGTHHLSMPTVPTEHQLWFTWTCSCGKSSPEGTKWSHAGLAETMGLQHIHEVAYGPEIKVDGDTLTRAVCACGNLSVGPLNVDDVRRAVADHLILAADPDLANQISRSLNDPTVRTVRARPAFK